MQVEIKKRPYKGLPYSIEQWKKPAVKKPVDRAGQKPVNRRWFWNLPVGSGRENPDRFDLWYELINIDNTVIAKSAKVLVLYSRFT